MSIFKAPISVIDTLEKIRRKFLWGGVEGKNKIHWVSWDKVTAPKECGGLGVGSIRALNVGLIVKWWWRLQTESTALWSQVITGIHSLSNKPYDYLSKKTITGVWKNIAGTIKDIHGAKLTLNDIFKLEVKSGESTMLWQDNWLNNEKLKSKYPSLYALELCKTCSVAYRILNTGNSWEWKSCPLNAGLSIEFNRLNRDIASCQIQTGQDKWMCLLTPDGRYTVEALRRRIDLNSHQSIILPQISWCKIIPIKVLCFTWRAGQGRIPSATALQHRGMNIDSTHCSSCIGGVECVDHILIGCLYASYIREKIFEWCGIKKQISEMLVTYFNLQPHGVDAPRNVLNYYVYATD
uniref:Reverse transcriptase zinc-binding domain-containing protein n=1 Tax=Lactuca sativa TaxID=4236 RepID=A0A9R1XBJ9_LACSA|nr:hypothetical protein LSAT_V11C500287950 [Lactuca sativa]